MNLTELLSLKYPGRVGWCKEIEIIDRNDGNGLVIGTWAVSDPLPTKKDLIEWAQEYELEYKQNLARDQRALAYPPVQEQLDMQYHDKINGTTTWQDAIGEVKTSIPIPTE